MLKWSSCSDYRRDNRNFRIYGVEVPWRRSRNGCSGSSWLFLGALIIGLTNGASCVRDAVGYRPAIPTFLLA